MNNSIELCEEEKSRLYSLFDNCLAQFLDSAKLDHSEKSFDILKYISNWVIDDLGESWYKRSLGKTI